MSESKDLWTVGDVLNAMSGAGAAKPSVPDYVHKMLNEVQTWLSGAMNDEAAVDLLDIATGGADRNHPGDIEYLFDQLEWAAGYADVIPATHEAPSHEEAVILSVGPIVLDEGMRMMVDHAALFAAETCRRVWMISDTWVIGDIMVYMPHIRALAERGIELRFMLVTPWGYSEIPWNRS